MLDRATWSSDKEPGRSDAKQDCRAGRIAAFVSARLTSGATGSLGRQVCCVDVESSTACVSSGGEAKGVDRGLKTRTTT